MYHSPQQNSPQQHPSGRTKASPKDRDLQQQSIERVLQSKKRPDKNRELNLMWEKCRESGSSAGTRRPQTSNGELSADEGVTATVKEGVLIVHTVHADAAGLL